MKFFYVQKALKRKAYALFLKARGFNSKAGRRGGGFNFCMVETKNISMSKRL